MASQAARAARIQGTRMPRDSGASASEASASLTPPTASRAAPTTPSSRRTTRQTLAIEDGKLVSKAVLRLPTSVARPTAAPTIPG